MYEYYFAKTVASKDFLDGRPAPTASGSGTPTADEYPDEKPPPPPPPAICGLADGRALFAFPPDAPGLDLVLPELMGEAEDCWNDCWNAWSTMVGEEDKDDEDGCCAAKLMLLLLGVFRDDCRRGSGYVVGVCIDCDLGLCVRVGAAEGGRLHKAGGGGGGWCW